VPRRPAEWTLVLATLLLGACGERKPAERSVSLPVRVTADSAVSEPLHVEPPRARVWLARVSDIAPPVSPLGSLEPPLPEAPPDSAFPEPAPPALEVDPNLKPPILRVPASLRVPAASRGGSVELDVRIDEHGEVAEASWAGGSADTALVRAAREAALGMRFYPALRAGEPVAVWCRQRFDFDRRR